MIVAGVCRKRKKKKRSRNIARPCIIAERVYMVWSIRNDSIGRSCQRCFLCTQKSWISTKPKISLTTKYWLRHLVAFHKWCSYVWYSRFVFTDGTGSVYGNNKYVIIGRIHFDAHISFAVVSLQRFFFFVFVICYWLWALWNLDVVTLHVLSTLFRVPPSSGAQAKCPRRQCLYEGKTWSVHLHRHCLLWCINNICLSTCFYIFLAVCSNHRTASHRIWFRFGCTVVSYSLV